MADVSLKELKLAAARKKLKNYQKKKGDGSKISKSRESSPYLEVLNLRSEPSSSRSSSITDISETGCNNNNTAGQEGHDGSTLEIQTSTLGKVNENGLCKLNTVNNPSSQVPYNQTYNYNNTTISYSVQNDTLNNSNLINNEEDKRPCDKLEERSIVNEGNTNVDINSTPLNQHNSNDNDGSVCSETNASVTTVVHVKNNSGLNPEQDIPLRSTTESLRQLSLQMSGLVNDAEMPDPNRQELAIIELERRNNELASLLESEKQKSAEQNSSMEEMKRTIESQNAQLVSFHQNVVTTESNGTEVNGLREQLQVHIQTIGILVSEKSELQTSLTHVRYALDQKNGEVTELQGRLDASREHVTNLESLNQDMKAQLNTVTGSKEDESQQLLNLQTNYSKLSKLCDEMRASTAELTERLAVRTEENQKLNSELAEVRRQYELALVHVEQLRDNSTDDLKTQFDELQEAFSESQTQIKLSLTTLDQAYKEKDQLEFQYKSYTSQLAAESQELKQKLAQETAKCEELEGVRIKLESELEAAKVELRSRVAPPVEKQVIEVKEEVNDSLKKVNQELEHKCESLVRDNGHLSQLLAEQTSKLEMLETAVDRSSTQKVDTTHLLQTMQSDKVAAARALSQNKQLKEQLEELQNGFIMMSNKKLELTEKLEKELHLKKNLYQEISQLGGDLNSHKERLVSKQREIEAIKRGNTFVPSFSANTHVHGDQGHDHQHDHGHDHHHDHQHHEEKPTKEVISDTQPANIQSSDKSTVLVESGGQATETTEEKGQTHIIPTEHCQNHQLNDEVSLRVAHAALEKKFFKCMRDLADTSDEKQNMDHLVQQLQLETETVGDYITIYQFQRGVMKQQMQELNTELDLMKTEKQDVTNKLAKLHTLVGSLATEKGQMKDGFIEGINSIMNETRVREDGVQETPNHMNGDDTTSHLQNGTLPSPNLTTETETQSGSQVSLSPRKKSDTVRQIIDLISEMESNSHLDLSSLHKFHPCPHCSGKLITI